ncbi:RMD5-like protein [Chloropicon primus]|uniref:RMD5-like protein n=1 Tax=Chloropicon primus TaxID=1764295 RepID=A0A5B8MH07_9CHLO|nr:RMD5-like protein [Chloropicon primus]UPQ98574.1 RMD5-like protein [Chloropicon primus]|eukprot:QDZ19364.1 RMD5-like protein [Chloropicon primus]
MGDALFAAIRDIDRVAKKQRTCSAKTAQYLSQMEDEIRAAKAKLEKSASREEKKRLLKELHDKLLTLRLPGQIEDKQKEFYGSVSRLGKSVDKHFKSESFGDRETNLDDELLDKVIANHFFREGEPQLGQTFCEEANVSVSEDLKQSFLDMHVVVSELKNHNVLPALEWVKEKREEERASPLEFKLHSMQFLRLLGSQGCKVALNYARTNLSQFANTHMLEIRQLMGCLLYHNNIARSPYKELLSEMHWETLRHTFVRECCSTMGQACESPLLVASAAGSLAIPTLAKFATVMGKKQDWTTMEQLPVEIDLGHEFTFYSIFACPISRDQASRDDPPMMLLCGHVLSKQSVTKLNKSNSKPFKCPYCPSEQKFSDCVEISF